MRWTSARFVLAVVTASVSLGAALRLPSRSAQSAAPSNAPPAQPPVERSHPYRIHRPAPSEGSAPAPSNADMVAQPPVAETPAAAPAASAQAPQAGGAPGGPARIRLVTPPGGGGGGLERPPTITLPPQIRMQVSTASVSGALTTTVAQNAIRIQEGAIGFCYQLGLRVNPSLQGLLLVRLTVQPSGAVQSADVVVDYVQSSDVANCIATRLRFMRFPATRVTTPSTVVYRIRLSQS